MLLFRNKKKILEDIHTPEKALEIEHTITQLSKNNDILRKQTVQGFWFSILMMATGFIFILLSLQPQNDNGVNGNLDPNLISGIVVEFIAGTGLLLYQMNFRYLRDNSEKLAQSLADQSGLKSANEFEEPERTKIKKDIIQKITKTGKYAKQEKAL